MNTYPVDFVKLQQGGTCWFHASLNGWLLSSKGRELLLVMLREFKKKYSLSNSNTTCPRRGTLPLGYFWHYVENIITGRSWNLRSTVLKYKVGDVISNVNRVAANMTINKYLMTGPNMKLRERLNGIVEKARVSPGNFVNSHLIHNVGLRNTIHPSEPPTLRDLFTFFGISTKTQFRLFEAGIKTPNNLKAKMNKSMFANEKEYNQLNRYFKSPRNEYARFKSEGGTYGDAIAFCKLLFGPAYSRWMADVNPETIVFTVPYQPQNPREITLNGVKYVMSHSFLILKGYRGLGNHAVCGFIYNGRQFISDSNKFGFFARHSWDSEADMNKYIRLTGTEAFSAKDSVVFYVRENVTNYAPNMNALAARRNIRNKYEKIRSLLKAKNGGSYKEAYKLLITLPNKKNSEYLLFKNKINTVLNAAARATLTAIKALPNNSPSLRIFLTVNKNLPHYQIVRNEVKKKLEASSQIGRAHV